MENKNKESSVKIILEEEFISVYRINNINEKKEEIPICLNQNDLIALKRRHIDADLKQTGSISVLV